MALLRKQLFTLGIESSQFLHHWALNKRTTFKIFYLCYVMIPLKEKILYSKNGLITKAKFIQERTNNRKEADSLLEKFLAYIITNCR